MTFVSTATMLVLMSVTSFVVRCAVILRNMASIAAMCGSSGVAATAAA